MRLNKYPQCRTCEKVEDIHIEMKTANPGRMDELKIEKEAVCEGCKGE